MEWRADSSAIELTRIDNRSVVDAHSMRVPVRGEPEVLPERLTWCIFAPDGQRCAAAVFDRIEIRRGHELLPTITVPGLYREINGVSWSHDGRTLLVVADEAERQRIALWTVPVDGGVPHLVIEEPRTRYGVSPFAAFAPDDRGILYLRPSEGEEKELAYVPLRDGAAAGPRRILIEGWAVRGFQASNDGKRIAFVKRRLATDLWIADVEPSAAASSDVRWRQLLDDPSPKRGAVFSPDGKAIAYSASDGPGFTTFVVPATGGTPRRLGPEAEGRTAVAWSPDGSELVIMAGTPARLWIVTLADGRMRPVPNEPISEESDLSWAPAPFISYRVMSRRNFVLYDPATGQTRRLVPDEDHLHVSSIIWAPDGQHAAGTWNPNGWREAPQLVLGLFAPGEPPRVLTKAWLLPIGWSPDGHDVFVETYDGKTLQRVSVDGGAPRPWLALDRRKVNCTVSLDARHLACTGDSSADVWIMDDFDRILPR